MNFIIKKIIKRVFEKYLNLQEQLNIESGLIKLPYGKINQEEINKKLQPFNIQISESIYKNLSISIPLTEIISKPIKISIERFEVVIAKKKRNKAERAQGKPSVEKLQKDIEKSDNSIEIDKEVDKYSKAVPAGKEQVNSGYIKNMVNRLLYNMEILFEKIVIKMEKDQQQQDRQGFERYFSDVEFQIHQLHLRNSLVLLEANIIKKIFNLQQILIKHKYAQLIINDFNICLDYNNRKLNVIAILGNIFFNIKNLPFKEIQKLLTIKKKKINKLLPQPTNIQITNSKNSDKNIQNEPKRKPIELNIYIKITQSVFQIQNILSLKGQVLEIKMKKFNQKPNDQLIICQKHTQIEILFKSLLFVHLSEEPVEEKDFLVIRYLPWCEEVKIFSQYEDNILKSSLIKLSQKEIHRKEFSRLAEIKKDISQINSSTSFDEKKSETLDKEWIRKQMGVQLYYFDLMADFQIAKKVVNKILTNQELKSLVSLAKSLSDEKETKKQYSKQLNPNNEEKNAKKQEVAVQFIVYRLMINVHVFDQFSVQLYGSFRGGYYLNEKNSDATSFTESSLRKYHSKSFFANQHLAKHTHKKRYSNRETSSKITNENEVEKQDSPSKVKSQSSKIQKGHSSKHHKQKATNEQIRLQMIQMCVECKNYKVIDFGNFEVKVNKSKAHDFTEIVAVGTHVNSELSIKLIKDIIDVVPLIQNELKCILANIHNFIGREQSFIRNPSEIVSFQTLPTKEKVRKSRISIYVKLNEVNLKLGSLLKITEQNLLSKQKFVWIFLLEICNLTMGAKLMNAIKIKFSTMMYVTSPHMLHRISITQNPVDFKIDYVAKGQTVFSVCNDLKLDLNENSLQILLKYFSQITDWHQKTNSRIDQKRKKDQRKISDSDCYFVEFYNSTHKQIKVIQSNEYQLSQDSINLSEFQENQQNDPTSQDCKLQQKINTIKRQSCSIMFWLNEYYLIIMIDGCRSLPISLQFNPHPISQLKANSKFHFQHEETIKFQEEKEKVQNKYVIQFLLNSIGKIQKIIIKNNACFLSYKSQASILHNKSGLIAPSNLALQNSDKKITDNFIFDLFRSEHFIHSNQIENPNSLDVNYEFLLDLNQQSKNISFQQQSCDLNKIEYKVSSLLLRSPNYKPQNSVYSLFGIYQEETDKKQQTQINSVSRLFKSYLYQIRHLQTCYFVQMPFLIIENNLSCDVIFEILDKKTQIIKFVKLNSFQKKELDSSCFQPDQNPNFDFYNKQFTMKIKLVSKLQKNDNKKGSTEHQIIYESQQHYFNTFFMVEHEFQTLIALRSNKKYQFDKKYVFLREELMLKTKVLKLQSSCRIINKTNFNFGLKIKRSLTSSLSEAKSPRSSIKPDSEFEVSPQNQSNFTLLPEQQQNNHFLSKSKSEIEVISQFRPQEFLQVLFENLEQTKVIVHEEVAKQGLIQILSFNFAQKQTKQNQDKRKYSHLLFRLRLKTIENHQFIIIENFITFQNLSLENVALSLNPEKNIAKEEQVIFPLPPTTIKKFNNRVIILNNLSEIESLYEELFSLGFDDKAKSTNSKQKKLIITQKILEQNFQKNTENTFITISDKALDVQQKIFLKDLLFSKNNIQQLNLGKKGIKIFSLLKDIKGGIIRLFFLEKIFNPNMSYLLLQNNTNRNFLLSSDKSQYTHHFIKNQARNQNSRQVEEQKSQKVFVYPNTFSILSNKDDFQLFICDKNGKHLEKSTKQNLEKESLQMQFHTTENFQLVDLSEVSDNKNNDSNDGVNQPKFSVKTHLISININLYSKIFLNLSISNLGVRILEKNKIDFLVQDVSIKNNLTNQHILRIPEESYVLFEGKFVGNQQNTNFILIKNLFVKCKNIIINLEKDLPYRIICLCKNLIPNSNDAEQLSKKKYYFDNEAVKLFFHSIQYNQGLEKLKLYIRQHLFLIKNIYLHQIHLSLSLDIENNTFSNVMVIPHYEITNSFMREKNLLRDIAEFYKTNILAKLPKLSFIFTNLKNPMNLIRTMMKVSSALSQKIQQKNILTFDHDQIPQNDRQFSLQRWNFMHRKCFDTSNPQGQSETQELLAYLYKNECYYLVSNRNFIMMSLNSKNISKEQEGTLIHYERNSEQSLGSKSRGKWERTYENSMIRLIPLKELEKIKLIRNKKYSEFAIYFKGNITINICDDYQKCAKLIDTINSLVM